MPNSQDAADGDPPERRVRVWLRIVGPSEASASALASLVEVGRSRRPADGALVLLVPVEDGLPVDTIVEATERSGGTWGIYVSLVTDSDHDGVAVPAAAVELLRRLGGTLDFSVTRV